MSKLIMPLHKSIYRMSALLGAGILFAFATFISCEEELASRQGSQYFTEAQTDSALAYCHAQVLRTMAQEDAAAMLQDDEDFNIYHPRNIEVTDTVWSMRSVYAVEWCSGFWPGILWYDYAFTGDQAVATAAVASTMAMQLVLDEPTIGHDLGVMLYSSAGTGLHVLEQELQRTDLTVQERSADSLTAEFFNTLLVRAADSLATLQSPSVNAISSWPNSTAMFWGYFSHNKALQEQTESSNMADSIYGFTMCARETGSEEFLIQAQQAAENYLQHFSETIPDVTAATVAASALIELSTLSEKKDLSQLYIDAAAQILSRLSSDRYQSHQRNAAFLLHSPGDNTNQPEANASEIRADYYYIEALTRYKALFNKQ